MAWPGVVTIESDGAIEDVDSLKSVRHGAGRLGANVFENTFDDVLQLPAIARRFPPELMLSAQCRSCELLETCGGGHLPHRYGNARGYCNPSVYCRDLEYLIRHIRQSAAGAIRTVAR